MAKKHRSAQPTATSRTTAEPPVFHLQSLPDPDGHLSEEQKKWPLTMESKFRDAAPLADSGVGQATSPSAALPPLEG